MVSTRRTNTLRKRKVHSTPCKTKSPQKSTRRIKQATLKQAVKVKCDHGDTSRKKKIFKKAKVKPDPTENLEILAGSVFEYRRDDGHFRIKIVEVAKNGYRRIRIHYLYRNTPPDEWISFRQVRHFHQVQKKQKKLRKAASQCRRAKSVISNSGSNPIGNYLAPSFCSNIYPKTPRAKISSYDESIDGESTSGSSVFKMPVINKAITPGGFDLLNNRWNDRAESSSTTSGIPPSPPQTPAAIIRKRLKQWERKGIRRMSSQRLFKDHASSHDDEVPWDRDSCIYSDSEFANEQFDNDEIRVLKSPRRSEPVRYSGQSSTSSSVFRIPTFARRRVSVPASINATSNYLSSSCSQLNSSRLSSQESQASPGFRFHVHRPANEDDLDEMNNSPLPSLRRTKSLVERSPSQISHEQRRNMIEDIFEVETLD